MSKLLSKISSYNILNNLVPGFMYYYFMDIFFHIKLISDDTVLKFFFFYFIGICISRIGSLIIEPILKIIHFTIPFNHTNYINASMKDSKIEVLYEINNSYRTIIALFVFILISYIYNYGFTNISFSYPFDIILFGFILFMFSYRKQSNYIHNRVSIALQDEKTIS
ncbi:Uncharacterised protein [Megamonas hypermegale]|uniref:Uncharacterized protein n=1 Tax=Megamonas hypermegale TaxID=158847 RepID=A0A239TRQ5_9FIRM|nr:hypothetical protein [Megamonas hypermegale]SNU99818.1 Uncharacterised protein [Megamonas hypermegale]